MNKQENARRYTLHDATGRRKPLIVDVETTSKELAQWYGCPWPSLLARDLRDLVDDLIFTSVDPLLLKHLRLQVEYGVNTGRKLG